MASLKNLCGTEYLIRFITRSNETYLNSRTSRDVQKYFKGPTTELTLEEEGGGILKKISCKRLSEEKIACSTNVIESLWEKKGKKYPAHQIDRKKKS